MQAVPKYAQVCYNGNRPLIPCGEGAVAVMKKIGSWVLLAALALGTAYYLWLWPGGAQTAFASTRSGGRTLVLDAGHGGEDGGAVSPSGAVESGINLTIVLRLDQLLGLYGEAPVLLRSEDVSLHDESADTLREKKVSDLHNRAARIEDTEEAVLISVHQNTYPDSQYHGAQVFFAAGEESRSFAELTQGTLREALDPDNSRQAKPIPDTVYLMNHITCPAILVECGFLSNPQEEELLQSGAYQSRLAAALAASWLQWLEGEGSSPSLDT